VMLTNRRLEKEKINERRKILFFIVRSFINR